MYLSPINESNLDHDLGGTAPLPPMTTVFRDRRNYLPRTGQKFFERMDFLRESSINKLFSSDWHVEQPSATVHLGSFGDILARRKAFEASLLMVEK
ncbi:hypothetical protein NPIL_51541 [Nephila pilipes]|uniref:Uncharacterized protein n=1 Tax=Nephila pilipes TaxID=299642 RepID=A0A8X6Q322_NEPPI|nr:hypothetical protein NPIL_51541 [Nephila pilipes]